jgi:hypothetical protein
LLSEKELLGAQPDYSAQEILENIWKYPKSPRSVGNQVSKRQRQAHLTGEDEAGQAGIYLPGGDFLAWELTS